MGVPILDTVRGLMAARADIAKIQIAAAALTALLGLVAAALVCAAGLVALSQAIGFPLAALVVALGLGALALAVSLGARKIVLGKKARALHVQRRAEQDMALAGALTRSARPLVPLAAFLAVFFFARRS